MTPRVPIYVLTGTPRAGALPGLDSSVAARRIEAEEASDAAEGAGAPAGTTDGGPDAGEPGAPAAESHSRAPAVEAAGLRDVGAIDRALVGCGRPEEHRFWLAMGGHGFLYRKSATGELAGYGYVHDSGRIGPVGVLDAGLLPGVLGHLLGEADPVGAWQVLVPGPAASALVPLIRAGLRIDGSPGIYSATWEGPRFDRYLPMNFALL